MVVIFSPPQTNIDGKQMVSLGKKLGSDGFHVYVYLLVAHFQTSTICALEHLFFVARVGQSTFHGQFRIPTKMDDSMYSMYSNPKR